jgi:hypothetical protein
MGFIKEASDTKLHPVTWTRKMRLCSAGHGNLSLPTWRKGKRIHNSSITALTDTSSASSHFQFFSLFLWHTLSTG